MNSGRLLMQVRKLNADQKREIRRRERRYRDKLAKQGYKTSAVVDESGCFGIVLLEDPESGRKGLVLPNGKVRWMDQAMGPGALADATVSGVTIDFE